jgi:hypothetical protein
MAFNNASDAAMAMRNPDYLTGGYQPPARSDRAKIRGYQPAPAPLAGTTYADQESFNTLDPAVRFGYASDVPEPYVAPEPIVQALRQRSLNPEGIRRNAKTFQGTTNAPVAPEGKTNPSGANRSAQVTSQV